MPFPFLIARAMMSTRRTPLFQSNRCGKSEKNFAQASEPLAYPPQCKPHVRKGLYTVFCTLKNESSPPSRLGLDIAKHPPDQCGGLQMEAIRTNGKKKVPVIAVDEEELRTHVFEAVR